MEVQPTSAAADISGLCVKEGGQERAQEMHWISIHSLLKSVKKTLC